MSGQGKPPAWECEHYWLKGNCPFCVINDLRAQIARNAVTANGEPKSGETAALKRQLESAAQRVRALEREVALSNSACDAARRRIAQLERSLKHYRAAFDAPQSICLKRRR